MTNTRQILYIRLHYFTAKLASRNNARSCARSTRRACAVRFAHKLLAPAADSHTPLVARLCLASAVAPFVSSPGCTSVLPHSSDSLTSHRCGSPCRQPLPRCPADTLWASDSVPRCGSTPLRFHPPGPESPPPSSYLPNPLLAGSPPTPL